MPCCSSCTYCCPSAPIGRLNTVTKLSCFQVTNKSSNGVPTGVFTKELGKDEYGKLLARAHAAVVSDFVKRGHVAAQESHAAPPKP